MARMIDGDKLMELFKEQYLCNKSMKHREEARAWQGAIQLLYDMPTLTQPKDSTPVQHGRWVKPVPGDGENYCSVCHTDQPWFYGYGYYDSDYCPNCGARMDAKEALKDGVDD